VTDYMEITEAFHQARTAPDVTDRASAFSAGIHGAVVRPCPLCRGYNLERRWCGRCSGRGVVEVSRHG